MIGTTGVHSERIPVCTESAFCCYSTDDHIPPHSFPTRRSSDLYFFAALMFCTDLRSTSRLMMNGLKSSSAISFGRSEEHTSELQSRLHLVCRLLLEKKKWAPLWVPTWARLAIIPR